MTALTGSPRDRAALALGLVGVVSPVFALTTSSNNNFVLVQNLALLVFPALGLVAIAGALTRRRALITTAGGGFALVALVQLFQLGRETNWLDGNGSTFAVLLALAVGLLVTSTLVPTRPFTPDPPAT